VVDQQRARNDRKIHCSRRVECKSWTSQLHMTLGLESSPYETLHVLTQLTVEIAGKRH
jgi:hypothetical protein